MVFLKIDMRASDAWVTARSGGRTLDIRWGTMGHARDEPTPPPIGKEIFTTGEAAELCRVSQQTIIRCFDRGRLGGFRVPGSRFRRIPRADLSRFMDENGIPNRLRSVESRRILIVDDDPAIVRMVSEFLRRDPTYELRSAGTGYDAGLLTREFRPHLILLDYMLPDINGNEVCKRIRADADLGTTKIVIVSGVVRQEEIDDLLASGADDFLPKPLDPDLLSHRMDRLLAA